MHPLIARHLIGPELCRGCCHSGPTEGKAEPSAPACTSSAWQFPPLMTTRPLQLPIWVLQPLEPSERRGADAVNSDRFEACNLGLRGRWEHLAGALTKSHNAGYC